MGLVSYIVVGAIIGCAVGLLSRRSGGRLAGDVGLGIVGGLVGGGIARIAGLHGVIHAFNARSFIISVVCAVALVLVMELLTRRRPQQR
jgi:uncharacterized membrane protein YeaQ/YmgE (transglycosylase-associated protein family)